MPGLRGRGAERGFGLLLVVVALAVMGVLTLGAFGAARRELRNSSQLRYAVQAFEAAEAGLAAAGSVAAGAAGAPIMVRQPGPGSADGQVSVTTTIVRLNESLLLLTAEGRRLDGGGDVLARRVLGLVGRVVPGSGAAPPRFEPLSERGWAQLYD